MSIPFVASRRPGAPASPRAPGPSGSPVAPGASGSPAASVAPVAGVWRPGLRSLAAPLPHLRSRLTRLLCRGLVATGGRLVTVEHAERLASLAEPAIFALNHRTALEALLAPAVLLHLRQGRPVHFLADWMYVDAPLIGWLLRRAEPIPVYGKPARWRLRERYRRRQLHRRPVLAACLAALGRGESVGIFPEGTRNRRTDTLLPGRPGLGELVLAAAVPVVPIAIRYPSCVAPATPPPLGRMVLTVGAALDFAAERRRLAAAPSERRALARHIVVQVMTSLADALDARRTGSEAR